MLVRSLPMKSRTSGLVTCLIPLSHMPALFTASLM